MGRARGRAGCVHHGRPSAELTTPARSTGKRADFIVLAQNPLVDIRNTRSIESGDINGAKPIASRSPPWKDTRRHVSVVSLILNKSGGRYETRADARACCW